MFLTSQLIWFRYKLGKWLWIWYKNEFSPGTHYKQSGSGDFYLTFELDKDQDHTDISVRVFLSEITETLGHTSKTWSANWK